MYACKKKRFLLGCVGMMFREGLLGGMFVQTNFEVAR